MKTIKNGLLTGLAIIAIVSFIGALALGAWHCYVIAICSIVLGTSIYEPKKLKKL